MAVTACPREMEISRLEVRAFCELLLADGGPDPALSYIHRLLTQGRSRYSVYSELMAGAARELGSGWDSDRWSFSQVSQGLLVLQTVLQELSTEWRAGHCEAPDARRILLLPVPGSQHTFGLLMVAEFFRFEGWQVWADPMGSVREIVDLTRKHWFDVVGFSIGMPSQVNAARQAILLVRKQSSNRQVRILVGGPAILADPGLGKWLYADIVAQDGREAVLNATQLVNQAEQAQAESS